MALYYTYKIRPLQVLSETIEARVILEGGQNKALNLYLSRGINNTGDLFYECTITSSDLYSTEEELVLVNKTLFINEFSTFIDLAQRDLALKVFMDEVGDYYLLIFSIVKEHTIDYIGEV